MVLVVLFLAVLTLSACASGPTWKTEDFSNGLKGQTEEQIIQKFGQPDRKYSDSSGGKVFEYRKEAEKGNAMSAFAKFGSYGMMSGKDSLYVDILRITLRRGRVIDFSYEENVTNIAMPGGVAPLQTQMFNAQLGSIDDEKPKNTRKVLPKSEADTFPGSILVASFKSSRVFPGEKVSTLYNRITNIKDDEGMSVEKGKKGKKGSSVTISVASSKKRYLTINVSIVPSKRGTRVDLSLTTSDMSYATRVADDFQKIYDACKP